MFTNHELLKIGTCSWNYPSWVGLIYTTAQSKAAGYLPEYATHFPTTEIDSWFYKLPSREEVLAYKRAVPDHFRFTPKRKWSALRELQIKRCFRIVSAKQCGKPLYLQYTCKVPQSITLTQIRQTANENFLSVEKFKQFLGAIEPLHDLLDAVIFEFEYLNKTKMASAALFIEHMAAFIDKIPTGFPYAIEPRNPNYFHAPYFSFIKEKRLMHVFSEKIYMPSIYTVYDAFESYIDQRCVIRLLGGDRQAMEAKTGNTWNAVIEPKADLAQIIDMVARLLKRNIAVIMNVNNHYEGSAPLTIKRILEEC